MSETETLAPGAEAPAPARPFADRRVFPMNYALMQPLPLAAGTLRVGQSRRERATTIVCNGFYKPVSRCFLPHSPPAGEVDHGA